MSSKNGSEGPWILVVDDEVILAETTSEILKMRGYQVETAANGSEALEKLSQRSFALVITDMNMPKMDGLQLLTEVRQLYPQLKVIIVSGFSETDAAEALKRGAVAFLGKPIPATTLLKEISRHLAWE